MQESVAFSLVSLLHRTYICLTLTPSTKGQQTRGWTGSPDHQRQVVNSTLIIDIETEPLLKYDIQFGSFNGRHVLRKILKGNKFEMEILGTGLAIPVS
jgi:hypothetical protein